MRRQGLLLIISSPSGAGKSTLSKRLRDWDPTIRFSVSATTRPPRSGEIDGKDYLFRNRDEFEKMVQNNEMLEHAEVFEHYYGSPREPVEIAMAEGCDTLFDIDWQGGKQILNSDMRAQVVSVFILPPSIAELEQRLRSRGQDSDAVIKKRMAKSQGEISHWREYDYVLVNENIDTAEVALKSIVSGERLRRERQTGLSEFVDGLDTEFRNLTP